MLQEKIAAGVAGDAKLRQNEQTNARSVRFPGERDDARCVISATRMAGVPAATLMNPSFI